MIILTNQKKTLKLWFVYLGICYYFLRQNKISGFVVSELVVGFGEQDTSVSFFLKQGKRSMVYLYQSVQADL